MRASEEGLLCVAGIGDDMCIEYIRGVTGADNTAYMTEQGVSLT